MDCVQQVKQRTYTSCLNTKANTCEMNINLNKFVNSCYA